MSNQIQNTFIHFDVNEKPENFSIRRVQSSPALTYFGKVEKVKRVDQKRFSLPTRLDISSLFTTSTNSGMSPMMSPNVMSPQGNHLMVSPMLSTQSSGISMYSAIPMSPMSGVQMSPMMTYSPLGFPQPAREDKRGSLASISTTCSIQGPESPQSEEFQKPDRLARFAKNKAAEHKTTVMIRNIPCKCTQEHLVQEISQYTKGFNFCYLPMSRMRDGTLGYAFVNFVTADEASKFMDAFTGHKFRRLPHSRKRTEVTFAVLQGFRENVRFYRRSKVTKTEYGPYINREARSEVC
jgi:hypothetical protein